MSIEKKPPQAKYSVSDKEIQLYRNFNKNGYFAYRDELPTLYDGNIEFRWKDHELEEGSLYLKNQ